MGALSRFEVIENEADEYVAMLQVRSLCATVTLENGLYVPRVSDDEWGEACAVGQGMRTPELAAEAAIALAQGHLRAMSRAFRPFAEIAQEVVEVAS